MSDAKGTMVLARSVVAAAAVLLSANASGCWRGPNGGADGARGGVRDVPHRGQGLRSQGRAPEGEPSALVEPRHAWARLPADAHPEVARAEAATNALFPDGLAFLKLPYERQWAESQRRLDHIDTASLAAELDTLCGPAFLAAVRTAHANYGAALGITEVAPDATELPASLREPLAALRTALSRYVLRLLGTLDDEDPDAVRTVKAALRPIDDYRAAVAARAARPRGKGNGDLQAEPDSSPSIPA